jgi:hypothetical protein
MRFAPISRPLRDESASPITSAASLSALGNKCPKDGIHREGCSQVNGIDTRNVFLKI